MPDGSCGEVSMAWLPRIHWGRNVIAAEDCGTSQPDPGPHKHLVAALMWPGSAPRSMFTDDPVKRERRRRSESGIQTGYLS